MSAPELSFQRIEIRRMPGFADGGFTVDDLCQGVNIIYGPNASGKTTLGRAIQKLLRPTEGESRERSLTARLNLGGRTWTIDYDVGRLDCQQEGIAAELPPLAPPGVGDHYVLALHDLIRSDDGRDLAGRIITESAGGYDVAEARRTLGFRDRATGRGRATRDLDETVATRKEAMRKQDALVEEERKLANLNARRDEARTARGRLDWLDKALAHRDAAERQAVASNRLADFPAGLAKMTGDEIARLEQLDESIRSDEGRRNQEELLRQAALERVADCRLPEEGVEGALLGTLRQKCQRLRSLAAELPKRREEAGRTAARAAEARQNLGTAVDPAEVPRLDAATVGRLADHARRAETLRAEAAAAETLTRWLGPDPETAAESPETLSDGARLLVRWIAANETPGADGWPWNRVLWIASASVLAVSVLMGSFVHGSWFFLLPVALAAAAWTLVPRVPRDRGLPLRRDFEGLGIDRPAEWTPAEVRSLVYRLQQRTAEAALCRERAARFGDLSERRGKLAERRKEMEQERRELVVELGISLADADADETWLHAVAANIQRLQEDTERAREAAAALESATDDCRALLQEVNAATGEFGYDATDDPELAAERVEQLARRQQEHQAARGDAVSRNRAIDQIGQSLGEVAKQRAALFARLGLAEADEATLRAWTRQHPEYREAAEEARFAERDLKIARSALDDHADLAQAPRATLEAEQAVCRLKAAEGEELTQQIGEIEGRVRSAKESTDLEAAMAREEAAREALRRQRDEDCDAVVGHALADFLTKVERDRERPGVFQDAGELFATITHGRYRLAMEPGDPPSFRAIDTHRDRGVGLDELSSGTRLQLLLAVRVAFVQRQEQGWKLPLVLDETLGNSDERRAKEIIDAAIAICRGGRQVFYLTAQHDEVGKWRAMLKHHGDVPYRVVDLAEIRQFSETERAPPIEIEPRPEIEIPPPGDLAWFDYGRLLGVPALDPRGPTGGIHLWYLLDDLDALYRLLRQGVNRWGQFQTLAAHGHEASLGADSTVYRRAEAAARLIEAAARLWQIGRGRPVDRQALVDCPAVTNRFRDRVDDLVREVSGDARQLLAQIEAGSVKGFRTDKRKDLREYLAEGGYLDDREELSIDEIREQLSPRVFVDLDRGLLDHERVEQLLAMVCGA